eukprot:g3648.t1
MTSLSDSSKSFQFYLDIDYGLQEHDELYHLFKNSVKHGASDRRGTRGFHEISGKIISSSSKDSFYFKFVGTEWMETHASLFFQGIGICRNDGARKLKIRPTVDEEIKQLLDSTFAFNTKKKQSRAARKMNFDQQFPDMSLKEHFQQLAEECVDREINRGDVYGEGEVNETLEVGIAEFFKKTRARFFVTGTIAQNCALLAHWDIAVAAAEEKNVNATILLHPTSHLVHHTCLQSGSEQSKRFAELSAANIPQHPSRGKFRVASIGQFDKALNFVQIQNDLESLFQEDKNADKSVEKEAVQEAEEESDNAIAEKDEATTMQPTVECRIIVLEIPQRMNGGDVMSWDDLIQTQKVCKKFNVRMHMDGARLFEAAQYYEKSPMEVAELFDSVYLSFYKGLGGQGGAVLLGSNELIDAAMSHQGRLGAKCFSSTSYTLPALVNFQKYVLDKPFEFKHRNHRLKIMVEAITKVLNENQKDDAKIKIRFEPESPKSCMIHCYFTAPELKFNELCRKIERAHRAVSRSQKIRLFNRLRGEGYISNSAYFEWTMGPFNRRLFVENLEAGWKEFLVHLNK